jgi:hypothetical protein
MIVDFTQRRSSGIRDGLSPKATGARMGMRDEHAPLAGTQTVLIDDDRHVPYLLTPVTGRGAAAAAGRQEAGALADQYAKRMGGCPHHNEAQTMYALTRACPRRSSG